MLAFFALCKACSMDSISESIRCMLRHALKMQKGHDSLNLQSSDFMLECLLQESSRQSEIIIIIAMAL